MKFLIAFLIFCWPLVAVDLEWFTGEETGAEAAWDSCTVSDSQTRVRTGNWSLSIPGSGNCNVIAMADTGEAWLRWYVNVDVFPPALLESAVRLRLDGTATVATLNANTDGTFDIDGASSGANDFVADTWTLFEWHYKSGTGANAVHQLWIDGVLEIDISNSNDTSDVDGWLIEDYSDNTWYDDMAISSTARIFAGESIALRPNADASPDTFGVIGGSEPSWDDVDDDPPDAIAKAVAPTTGGPPVGQEWDLTTATVGTINTSVLIVQASHLGGGGGSETVRPNGTNDIVGYGTCTSGGELPDDPDSPDAAWCNGLANNVTSNVDVELATPTASPSSDTDAQEMRACLRSTGESVDPTCSIDVLEGNTVRVSSIFSGAISQTDCTAVTSATWTFVPGDWTDTTGAAVEFGVDCVPGGGNPNNRASGELGAIEWNVGTVSATTHKLIVNDDNNSDLLLGPDLGLTGSTLFYSLKATGASAPVSQADVDAYEVGMEQSVNNAPRAVIEVVWFMIDYVPAAAGGKRRAMVNLIATLTSILQGPSFAGITK